MQDVSRRLGEFNSILEATSNAQDNDCGEKYQAGKKAGTEANYNGKEQGK